MFSCENETILESSRNSVYLHSQIVCETCGDHSWNYNYSADNKLESIIFTRDFESVYDFNYNQNDNSLDHVIQEPVKFTNQGTFIEGYAITTFSYINDNEFFGSTQYFTDTDELINYDNIKYVFAENILKKLTFYKDDIDSPSLIQEFIHDEDGILLYYDNIRQSGTTRHEILSWSDSFKPYTVGMFGLQNDNNTLEFFPNRLISTKHPLKYKTYSTTSDPGDPTFLSINYKFIIDNYPSLIYFTESENNFLGTTYAYILAN
jgi:hypothetical protein